MTDDLATALRTLADSEPPPPMDVERVLHEGRRSLVRRRKAALGGGTAVLAVTGLAVAALAPPGSLEHRHAAPAATTPAPEPAPATPTTVRTLAPAVNQHDPIITRFRFGYLPRGFHADGGVDSPTHRNQYSWSAIADSASSDFQLVLTQTSPDEASVAVAPPSVKVGVKEHVPAAVAGASEAFWLGYGGGNVVFSTAERDYANLVWRLPSGELMVLTANNLQTYPDWKAQTLKAAANVIRQDRTVPMPIKVSGPLLGEFALSEVGVTRTHGQTISSLELDSPNLPPVDIIAYTTGADEIAKGMMTPISTAKTCKDSGGLTVCVATTPLPPASLTAIGGAQALLDRITSLGDDPANWTQDVLQ